MSKTVFISQATKLHSMNIFDIGSNKDHIDTGLMNSQLTNTLSDLDLSDDATHLCIPGHVLEMISESDEKSLEKIKSFVDKNNVKLLSVPFYNSSLSFLSSDELEAQLQLQEEMTSKVFNKSSDGFLCTDGILPSSIESIINKKFKSVFHAKDAKIAMKSPSFKLFPTKLSGIGASLSSNLSHANTKMETHLIAELKDIYSSIVKLNDSELLTTWRLLAHSDTVLKANVHKHSNDAYEHYTNVMNILNDVAHKIVSVKLAKKGLFQDKPIISNSPSSTVMLEN